MELLVDKTDNLNQQAFQFKKKSTQLKRAMWWKNTKLMVMLVFIVLVRCVAALCAWQSRRPVSRPRAGCGGLRSWPTAANARSFFSSSSGSRAAFRVSRTANGLGGGCARTPKARACPLCPCSRLGCNPHVVHVGGASLFFSLFAFVMNGDSQVICTASWP